MSEQIDNQPSTTPTAPAKRGRGGQPGNQSATKHQLESKSKKVLLLRSRRIRNRAAATIGAWPHLQGADVVGKGGEVIRKAHPSESRYWPQVRELAGLEAMIEDVTDYLASKRPWTVEKGQKDATPRKLTSTLTALSGRAAVLRRDLGLTVGNAGRPDDGVDAAAELMRALDEQERGR